MIHFKYQTPSSFQAAIHNDLNNLELGFNILEYSTMNVPPKDLKQLN